MVEIELKFKIDNVSEMIRRLKEIGFFMSPFDFQKYQKTVMHDNADKIMQKKDCRLRVRTAGENNIELSYKKPITREGIKKEIEYELIIDDDDGEEFKKILKEMGFEPVSSYEKYRTTLTRNETKADIDEYPFANYLEIEGSEEEIKKVANELGLDMKDNLTESCDNLFAEWRKERELKPKTNMLFKTYDKT